MSSPHGIAREHLDAAFAAARAAGVDDDRLCKALVGQLLGRWTSERTPADVRSAVEFELEHMAGDTDIEFMRP